MEEPEDVKKDYHNTVKGIKVYAKAPRRVKVKPKQSTKNGYCRLLSDEQIAEVEQKLIDSGEKITPTYGKEVIKMSLKSERAARLNRLAESMIAIIREKGYFQSGMIRNSRTHCDYIAPGNPKYFKRMYLDDIKTLGEKGLFYSKGTNPKTWYKVTGARPSSVEIDEVAHTPDSPPVQRVVIDINFNINVSLPEGSTPLKRR